MATATSAELRTAPATNAPVPPRHAHTNPIRTRADWAAARSACSADPGRYHGAIARREIHWYDPALGGGGAGAWITWQDAENAWTGYDARSGAPVRAEYGPDHEPWSVAFDESAAPFYRWFSGGLTNACFNEVDRHVLAGAGGEVAFLVEGDRWDQSLNAGRGGPVSAGAITRRALLWETAKAAVALRSLGLVSGDRIALNMPNIPEQVFYIEAAKRLGIIYTPVFGGFSDKTLSDRIHDAGAKVVVTADGGYRNAQVVPFKEAYTDPALDKYIAVEVALTATRDALVRLAVPAPWTEAILDTARRALADEITVERGDVMRGVGRALSALTVSEHVPAAESSRIRTTIAQALVDAPRPVETVIVVRHTDQPSLSWRPERDRWSHELTEAAALAIVAAAARAGFPVRSEADLLALSDPDFVRAMWCASRPEPVDAEFPLFFIYTSGSTGKPKGVVHVHGGYTAGVAHTMRIAFDARAGDVMYVIADPGWITGQSYMITAALATRVTSVLAEGAPVFPSAGRFASIIERYHVTIFKAGVTFLKTVMQDPQNVLDVRRYDVSSLRVCTFCAEPTSPSVQRFGMDVMTPWYTNSYWATEHGGIVWTHFYGNADFPLRADAHTYPLPWIVGDVWLPEGEPSEGPVAHRRAADGEKGEIVIERPYPYMARTIWGDSAGFRLDGRRVDPAWQGDIGRFARTYWLRWKDTLAYTQGDFAVRHADGAFSLHGRSDDVINVSGHRLGTEEIEGAILRDKQLDPASPVGNVIVVGAPHREKGLTALAFIKPVTGRRITLDDRRRLADLVRQEKGALAIPSDFLEVSQFPETRSGKYMRRMVRALVEGVPVGDATTLKNPESLTELAEVIEAWRTRQRLSDAQRIFETYRYLRVAYHELGPAARTAIVTVTNPPVNALNERALDELTTVVEHLARRDDVRGVIFTGDGPTSFVAGADIRQLLEEVDSYEEAIPLPNNAHGVFRRIERMEKPCIAAINGLALGGGLEFALACHFRIADARAVLGQPEIRLRLVPGYGGTQRLPRLLTARQGPAGLRRALELILGGRTVDADDARAIGLVDRVAADSADAVSLASALVREYVAQPEGRPGPLAQALTERYAQVAEWERPGAVSLDAALADDNVQRIVRQAEHAGRGTAVQRAVDAIRAGWDQGMTEGLRQEADLFARAVVDPDGGRRGIRDFLDKRSAPLPTRQSRADAVDDPNALLARGDLLPVGAPFFPGHTPLPTYQYAFAAVRDPDTGAALHGEPARCERQIVVPVEEPGPNEALVYVLASEVNFNDIWAITGIPVSQFDTHDADHHVTGSGGVGLIAALGSEVKREGRLCIGDLVTIYSGQSDLLSPLAGREPMFAGFHIQGYETPDGSHQQFLKVQAPQLFPVPADLTLEAAGSYVLNLGTVVRALFTTLGIQPGRTAFIEGAATGTGLEAVKSAIRHGVRVVGLVSSAERAAFVRAHGAAAAIDRREPHLAPLFTPVPVEPAAVRQWEAAGAPLVDLLRAANGGRLADYVVSHAGETAFPRSFQLLEPGGTLAFYGATSGYYFTFVGKPGAAKPDEMLRRAGLEPDEAVLLYYGTTEDRGVVDDAGLEAIEAARSAGARVVVVTYTDAQREFVQSLGFGDRVRGVVSLQELARREGDDFAWPRTMPPLPDPKSADAHRDAVRAFQERTLKPLGAAVGRFLRSPGNPRGYPDVIVERAGHDALGASTALVQPFTGRVVYMEDLGGRRFAFHAPQVWMRQRRISDAHSDHPRHTSLQRVRSRADEPDDRGGRTRGDAATRRLVGRVARRASSDVGESTRRRFVRVQSRVADDGPATQDGIVRGVVGRRRARRGTVGAAAGRSSVTAGRLHGKVALVTGAAGNIGIEICRRYLLEGATVLMAGRTATKLESARQRVLDATGVPHDRALAVTFDAGRPDEARQAARRMVADAGPVDIIVNNAGSAGPRQPLSDLPLTAGELARARAAGRGDTESAGDGTRNTLGVSWHVVRAIAPQLRAGASIVNVSTIFSRTPYYGRAAYVVPKAALNAWSRHLAAQLGPRGIRVNTVFPGPIESERIRSVFATMDQLRYVADGTTAREVAALMTLARASDGRPSPPPAERTFPTVGDVADAMVFLGSDESAAINGHDFEITHGMAVPVESRTTWLSRPPVSESDAAGGAVLVAAGDQADDAVAVARELARTGPRVLLGLGAQAVVDGVREHVGRSDVDRRIESVVFDRRRPESLECGAVRVRTPGDRSDRAARVWPASIHASAGRRRRRQCR